MLTAPLILIGQIFGAAFAAGLNLYLTVAVVGLTSRLDLIPSLPSPLLGLENSIVIASAITLYLVEFVLDKIPQVDSVWDALHTVIRPVAVALLIFFALATSPVEIRIAAAAFTFVVALAAHGTKAGLRIILNTAPRRWKSSIVSTIEDVCAAALAVAAIRFPVAALASAAGAILLLTLGGPRMWRAGVLALRAFRARLNGFFGERGWRGTDALPTDLKAMVPEPPLGQAEPRTARAALKGVPGVAAYRNGWIVVSGMGPLFVYRSLFRPRSLGLPPIDEPRVHRGLWTNAVEFTASGNSCTLFLLKDGPTPDIVIADISRSIA